MWHGCHTTAVNRQPCTLQEALWKHLPLLQVHAEANAVLNTNSRDLSGATMYVTMFPCNECAKLLIQAGMRRVVYFEVCAPQGITS
jgi:deoxycytidylate deaminase